MNAFFVPAADYRGDVDDILLLTWKGCDDDFDRCDNGDTTKALDGYTIRDGTGITSDSNFILFSTFYSSFLYHSFFY